MHSMNIIIGFALQDTHSSTIVHLIGCFTTLHMIHMQSSIHLIAIVISLGSVDAPHFTLHAPEVSPLHAPEVRPLHAPEVSPLHAPEVSPLHAPEVSPLHAPEVNPCAPIGFALQDTHTSSNTILLLSD